jgi:hypothetical protein
MNQTQSQTTIKAIRQRHGVTAQDLAAMAGVPLRVEYLMEIGCPVSQEDAAKIWRALSALTSIHPLAGAQSRVMLNPL